MFESLLYNFIFELPVKLQQHPHVLQIEPLENVAKNIVIFENLVEKFN